ncbi:WD40-repeat-containing domain protein [Multifurca ochricompacta]|uniref:WD40-repeat-containing domain protein n=1 Tax=Multifurca ochricompacta TaxID=376703 RepID=A0AAD4M6T2_9AGAM|nr:WD40-repeat-containing domain protein [Multifurca ochricompacta]
MSGLKNSPFGKRLRATQQDPDEDGPRRSRPRTNPIFGVAPASTPSLDSSRPSTSESAGPESPTELQRPNKDYGDRFVPSRDAGDLRTSYNLMEESGPSTPSRSRAVPTESDAAKEQANAIFTTILHTEVTPPSPRRPVSPVRPSASSSNTTTAPSTPSRRRLFSYNSPSGSNPSTPTRRLDMPTDEAYSMSPVREESRQILESPRRQLRKVSKTPYRVLDAPELADDFYLNLVDWSSTNVLGVGLGSSVYLWTAHTAAVSKLCDLASTNDTVSSVSWVQKGSTLAVGTLTGRLHIYDAHTLQLQRTYQQAHTQRIGALAWNKHVLSSGSRDRMVHHRDVREPGTRPFRKSAGHRQEVCGLRWNPDDAAQGGLLASGGNDNKVCIWDLRSSRRPATRSGSGNAEEGGSSTAAVPLPSGDSPLWKFHEHTAAVKALAWDPHVAGVLATGGGTQDKHIRFWNVQFGNMLSELDTGSQVCNLTWSLTSHEINQICIWKYPSLDMVASLTGHTSRVLYLAMNPDGETIVTGAGDETLRFWNAFPKREASESRRESRLDYSRLIR